MYSKDIIIEYATVFSQCERLSSFEGRNAISPTGESDFPNVHITEQDETLINDYTNQAVAELEKVFGKMVYSSSTDTDGITLTIGPLDNKRMDRSTLQSMASEAVASYVMFMWVGDKKPARAEFYQALFAEMCKSCQSSIYTKRKPTLEDIE